MMPRSFVLLSLALLLPACSEDGRQIIDPEGPDGVPPELHIAYPASNAQWDADGDGLMDVEITWQDEHGVDGASLTLVVVDGISGDTLPGSAALLAAWDVVSLTPGGVRLEETIEARLPAGTWALRATVADSTGTVGAASAGDFSLPRLALHRSITIGAGRGTFYTLSYCAARDEVYVVGNFVSVIDAQTLEVRERELPFTEEAYVLTCSGENPVTLANGGLRRFDVETLEWVPSVPPEDYVETIAVRADESTGLFVVAAYFRNDDMSLDRRIFRYDPATGATSSMESFAEMDTAFLSEIALVGQDLFVQGWPRGFWVMRDWTSDGTDLDHLQGAAGSHVDLEISEGRVFSAGVTDEGAHVVQTASGNGSHIDSWWLPGVQIADVAVSPDGDVFAALTEWCDGSGCAAVAPMLLTGGLCPSECQVPVPLPASVPELQEEDQAAFRSDGALLFWATPVATDAGRIVMLHAYLHREPAGS